MARSLVFLLIPVASAFLHDCKAQSVELKPFTAKEGWTFRQERSYLGESSVNERIQFSTLFKMPKGDFVLGFVSAVTHWGDVIWEPVGYLPPTTCVYDFVGKSSLSLRDTCKDGLATGRTWQSSSADRRGKERLTFIVSGQEVINVPAGKFNALKIIGNGERIRPDKSADKLTVTYWFAPDAKAMVRTTRAYVPVDGKPAEMFIEELTTYKTNDLTREDPLPGNNLF